MNNPMVLEVCDDECETCLKRDSCSGALEWGAHKNDELLCPNCGNEMERGRFWFIPARWQRVVFCPECGHEEKLTLAPATRRKAVAWLVILAVIAGCLAWYSYYPTPVGLMPLVAAGVALVIGFLAALGERGRHKGMKVRP